MKFIKLIKAEMYNDFRQEECWEVQVFVEGKSLFAPFVREVYESGAKQMTNTKLFTTKEEALSFAKECREKFGKKYKDDLSVFIRHLNNEGKEIREDFIRM